MISRIPKPVCVNFGRPGWSPEREQKPDLGKTCDVCGAVNVSGTMTGGSIKDGSRQYCAACCRTGFENQLKRTKP